MRIITITNQDYPTDRHVVVVNDADATTALHAIHALTEPMRMHEQYDVVLSSPTPLPDALEFLGRVAERVRRELEQE